MRMVRPKLDAPQITIAENQADFLPVTAALVRHPKYHGIPCRFGPETIEANSLVLAFRPNDDERARLAAGEDIYINLLTFLRPMQGIIVGVGPSEMASWFGVEVET